MIPYPHIDPVIVRVGPLAVRWYGLMYILGFAASYLLTIHQIKKRSLQITRAQLDDIYFWLIVGLLAGARLGYTLFYSPDFYLHNPLEILVLWHGGMSFHGGAIGTLIAGIIVAKRKKIPFLAMADLMIPSAPIGIALGRIGNFINGELFGRSTDVSWAMIFPQGGPLPRHPSQLYEAALEGLLLFLILWFYKERRHRQGEVFALFLILYAVFRTFCEFFREPDIQIGYFLNFLTMGQLLSAAMLIAGIVLEYGYVRRRPR